MATRASCATAATRSSSSRSTARSSRPPTWLLNGELPTAAALEAWEAELAEHTAPPAGIKSLLDGFQSDAHPMGVFLSTVGALSTHYPESKQIFDEDKRRTQIARLIAQAPVIGAYSYRRANGLPYVDPDPSLSFAGRFLGMLFGEPGAPYTPDPVLERALDILFILHADHEPELQHERDARHRQLAGRPVRRAGRRHGRTVRPAARRGQRGGAAHARRHRLGRQRAGLHQEGEGGARAA